WLTISLRLALAVALARISWLTISLRLALAPALFGRRGSRPLHFGAAALLQLRDKQAHGLQVELFDTGSSRPRPASCTRNEGAPEPKLNPITDLRPQGAKSES